MKIRPHHVVGLLAFILLMVAGGFWAFGYDEINLYTGETTSHYNWGGIIFFGIAGFAALGYMRFLQGRRADWPQSWRTAVSAQIAGLKQTGSGSGRVPSRRLDIAGPVDAQSLHLALLDTLAPDPQPGPQPRVYLAGSQAGRIDLAYGTAGTPPLWNASIWIEATAPAASRAVLTPGAAAPHAFPGGEVFDAMLAHVRSELPRRLPQVSVRATADAA